MTVFLIVADPCKEEENGADPSEEEEDGEGTDSHRLRFL